MSSHARRGRATAALFLPLGFLVSVPAAAQSADSAAPQTYGLGPVVVSANRAPTPSSEVGSSVTVITGQELQETEQKEVFDAFDRAPGVTTTQSGGLGSESVVRLRGAESGQVQVRLDGVEVNDPSSAAGDFNFAGLLSTGIDRIEVLRGPQSALYGSDAMGGVVSITTREPGGPPDAPLGAQAALEGGSFNTLRGSGELGATVGDLDLAFSGAGLKTDGFSRRDEDEGFVEDDGTRAWNLRGRGEAALGESLEASLAAGVVDVNSDLDVSSRFEEPGSQDRRVTYGRAALSHFGFDERLETTLALSASATDRQIVDPERTSEFHGSRWEAELTSSYQVDDWVGVLLGGDYELEKGRGKDKGGPMPGDRFDEDARTLSGFGIVTLEPAEELVLTLGARIDDFEFGGTHATYRATARYAVEETGTILRGSVGTAARAPTLFQLFDSLSIDFGGFLFQTEPNPDLQVETSLGVDGGFEQPFWDGRASLGLTGFYNGFDDLIEFQGDRYENVAEAETYGLEASATIRPTGWLQLTGAYTFLRARNLTDGTDLRRRPRNSAGLYTTVTPVRDLSFVVETRYVGEQYNDSDNEEELDPFVVFNVTAAYDIAENFTIYTRAENLFDADYQEATGFGTAGVSGYLGVRATF